MVKSLLHLISNGMNQGPGILGPISINCVGTKFANCNKVSIRSEYKFCKI